MSVSKLLRFSEAVSLALHAMAYLARCLERRVPSREMAQAFGGSTHHLAKVMQTLTKARLTKSVTGPDGGFRLTRPPESIRLLEIYEVIEGPLEYDGCLLEQSGCAGHNCLLGEMIQSVGRQVSDFLSRVTLAEMAERLQVLSPCTILNKA